jgi:hypothetical protein
LFVAAAGAALFVAAVGAVFAAGAVLLAGCSGQPVKPKAMIAAAAVARIRFIVNFLRKRSRGAFSGFSSRERTMQEGEVRTPDPPFVV